ncbi:hypothetical protein [Spirosoma pollinicola]|uniref:hypothetical protein n=1 Tax=Spirosoma pollinicola TaxID=2057025 RepID=UPI0012FE01EC|nr:hypothetical protein [Spirosoma pollinicola]
MNPIVTVYTAIPDTSDLTYWEVKITQDNHHSRTFVPRDKELHHRLKVQQRAEIDARLAKTKQQERKRYGSTF